jgi:hypothetical protein
LDICDESGLYILDELDADQVPTWPATRGRCYDHNFLRFSPIFGEKIGVFLENQCYDQFFFKI